MKTYLSIKHLSYIQTTPDRTIPILNDLSFDVAQGEILSIVGPPGCGKSILLHLIAGLDVPTFGNISIFVPTIGYMVQKKSLFKWCSIYQRADIPATKAEVDNPYPDTYQSGTFGSAWPAQFTGGMKQKASLIHTLASDPELLLLDAPFSALDTETLSAVQNDIWHMIRAEKKAAVLVTHDLTEAVSFSDRILILSKRPSELQDTMILPPDLAKAPPDTAKMHPDFSVIFDKVWRNCRL